MDDASNKINLPFELPNQNLTPTVKANINTFKPKHNQHWFLSNLNIINIGYYQT